MGLDAALQFTPNEDTAKQESLSHFEGATSPAMVKYMRRSIEQLLPMFIIDVLRYDIEQIPNIVSLLNDTGGVGWRDVWPRDFGPEEVYDALHGLIESGLVDVYIDLPENDEMVPFDGRIISFEQTENLWFLLTSKGRKAWEEWEDYPTNDADECSQ